jgi:MOSC domain-containing protein YiiM
VSGKIVQISVLSGGIPKTAVREARVIALGLDGDAHRNVELFGGPGQAVRLYAMEAITRLRAEGHDIVPGAIGENVTVEGLGGSTVVPGTYVLLGNSVLLQIARYTRPCVNITRSFKNNDFARVVQKRHPSWSRVYARVLMEGSISHRDPVRLLDEVEAADVTAVAR